MAPQRQPPAWAMSHSPSLSGYDTTMRKLRVLLALITLVVSLSPAGAADALRVDTFPNAKALPLYAGVAKGIFARHGLAVQLSFDESSAKLRQGLASGAF